MVGERSALFVDEPLYNWQVLAPYGISECILADFGLVVNVAALRHQVLGPAHRTLRQNTLLIDIIYNCYIPFIIIIIIIIIILLILLLLPYYYSLLFSYDYL
jgi:hypothetical protein